MGLRNLLVVLHLTTALQCLGQIDTSRVLAPHQVMIMDSLYYKLGDTSKPFSGIIEKKNNGYVEFKEYVNNGKTEFTCFFYASGTLHFKQYFKEFKEDGEYTEFYDTTGILKVSGWYTDGEKHNTWKYYNPAGELKSIGRFLMGTRFGVWRYFDGKGNILYEEHFDSNGKLINTITYKD